MNKYHINFYEDTTAQEPSKGYNCEAVDELTALTTWKVLYPIEEHPNIKFISMRAID